MLLTTTKGVMMLGVGQPMTW